MTYFRAQIDDGTEWLVPEPRSRSGWGGRGQLRGTAVSGALARAAERAAAGLEDAPRFRPVRWTVDLFRPAAVAPATTRARRRGHRLGITTFVNVPDAVRQAAGTEAGAFPLGLARDIDVRWSRS